MAVGLDLTAGSCALPGAVLGRCSIWDVERAFRRRRDLTSIAVVDRGVWLIDRLRFEVFMTGELGFGRALHHYHDDIAPVRAPALVMPAELSLNEVAQAALGRPERTRLDDIVIAAGTRIVGVLGVAAVMAHLAQHYRTLATVDPLTGIGNRRAFSEHLSRSVAEEPIGLIVIDVDRFKRINDHFGHDAGDAVLCAIAQRLAAAAGTTGIAARFGGDEFACILTGPPDQLLARAHTVHAALDHPVAHLDQWIAATCSVGVAFDQPGDHPDDVHRRADRALYQAKTSGGGSLIVDESVTNRAHQQVSHMRV